MNNILKAMWCIISSVVLVYALFVLGYSFVMWQNPVELLNLNNWDDFSRLVYLIAVASTILWRWAL
jgi:hypothetical protein